MDTRDDLEVTSDMQNYVAKQLSSLIDEKVQFVETRNEVDDPEDDADFGIRLFSNSAAPVTILEPQEEVALPNPSKKKLKWVPRIRDPSPDQKTKLAESVIDASQIFDQVGVSSWHRNEQRLNKKVDLYNHRNGNLFPVDPTNEFTKQRNKNNWDFKKISQGIKRKLE